MLAEQFVVDVRLKERALDAPDEYPLNLPVVQHLGRLHLHPKVTYLVGENGVGKSTLLEAIAIGCDFNAEGGSRNFGFSTHASHSSLSEQLIISRGVKKPRDGYFLRAETFYNVASEIEALDAAETIGPPIINSYGGKSLHEQSHGESFFTLFNDRFNGRSLFVLDEPEAALSPSRLFAMLARIHQLANKHCQFIIATHSPILMAYPDATLYVLSASGIQESRYEDTEHFQLTRSFLVNRQPILDELMKDD